MKGANGAPQEIFALSPDDIDFDVSGVHVRRQVKFFSNNRKVFALPKGRKTRKAPLPDAVRDAIAAYMTAYPPREVTLPWIVVGGKPTTVSLLLTSREETALNRNYFNTFLWRPALKSAGVPDLRENGCHALRHFFASTALHEGETIKAVSDYLGHADCGLTLRTYTHLMEDSSERTKRAIDAAFLGKHESDDLPSATRKMARTPSDCSLLHLGFDRLRPQADSICRTTPILTLAVSIVSR